MKRLILLATLLLIAASPASVIQQNSGPDGITAGSTHFKDVWARDALYASNGALAANITAPVKRSLDTLATHQKDGQIPLRVGRQNMLAVFLGLPTKTGPVYTNDKSDAPALDPNCLYTITLTHYVEHTENETYAKEKRESAKDAIAWLAKHDTDGDGLLEEAPYASWDDSIKKTGETTYTNACYYAALRAVAKLTKNQSYEEQAARTKHALNTQLYNGKYYDAWHDQPVFDVAANLLAVHWGVASDEQARSILDALSEHKADSGDVLPRTNYPAYHWTDVYFPFHLIGMGGYHNNAYYWTWIAALEAAVRKKYDPQQAQETLSAINKWQTEAGGIYEVYEAPGEPLDTLFYESEKDFSWAAGILLIADRS